MLDTKLLASAAAFWQSMKSQQMQEVYAGICSELAELKAHGEQAIAIMATAIEEVASIGKDASQDLAAIVVLAAKAQEVVTSLTTVDNQPDLSAQDNTQNARSLPRTVTDVSSAVAFIVRSNA